MWCYLPPLWRDIYSIKIPRKLPIKKAEYQKLIEPIKDKSRTVELAKYQHKFFNDAEHIDIILKRRAPSRREIDDVLDFIKIVEYRNYFFEKCSSLIWFDILKQENYFKPSKETMPRKDNVKGSTYAIPSWNILPYLEKVSSQVNIPGNESYIDKLLAIIKDVSNFKDSSGQHIDNYRTWTYFVRILLNLPTEKIQGETIDLIRIWLNSDSGTELPGHEIALKLLPRFLNSESPEDWKKAEQILDMITDIKWIPLPKEQLVSGEKEEPKTVVEAHNLLKTFSSNVEKITERCSICIIITIAGKLNEIFKRKQGDNPQDTKPVDYSFIWFPSLFSNKDIHITGTMTLLILILRDILLKRANKNTTQTREVLNEFLTEKYGYPLFKRLVLFIIGSIWESYKDIFFAMIEEKNGYDYFKFICYRNELFALFNNNHDKLTMSEKELIKRISGKYPQEFSPGLSVLQSSGFGPSTLSKDEIINLPNAELAIRLKEFKVENRWEAPTVAGLANLLEEVAKEMPEKFIGDMSPFKDTPYTYVYKILNGIKYAWSVKKALDWERLFDFIDLYIRKDEFGNDENIAQQGVWLGEVNHHGVAGSIAELIQEGTIYDSWAFPEEYIERAKDIIYILLKPTGDEEEISDYVVHTLNSSCGKLITALISLAFRIARVNEKNRINNAPRWSQEYKDKFDEMLNERIIEAYTSLGMFMHNLSYLDNDWVKDKIENLYIDKGSKYWEAFMDGYLYMNEVYDNLYVCMKSHYQYGLSHNLKGHRNNERLIYHICTGYLRGQEELHSKKSLFSKIINAWKPEQIMTVIEFFWFQRKDLRDAPDEGKEITEKIIEFWRQLYNRYKEKNNKSLSHDDKRILSAASRLAVFLPEIDSESLQWLKKSCQYVEEGHNSPFFIKCLYKLKHKGNAKETAKYIGEIYSEMLPNATPVYDQEHITSITEFLYTNDQTETANDICDTYGKRGYEFLRQLYEKYNK
ncbi:MAG: hypothetical protein SFH39_10610 [Candidatus Magnetobacterium sp. LHC-1]